MAGSVDRVLIDNAFQGDAKLKKRVFEAIEQTSQHGELFEEIARYHVAYRNRFAATGPAPEVEGPLSKKRKTENGVLPVRNMGGKLSEELFFQVKNFSFTIPQRKKLHLEIIKVVDDGAPMEYLLRARNPVSDVVEFQMPLKSYTHILRLPVPEKAQRQFNFCLLPKGLLPGESFPADLEPIIFTMNDAPIKDFSAPGVAEIPGIDVGSEDFVESALKFSLTTGGVEITYPREAEFASALPELHRKGDKTYHVKAYRNSKDGYLFFLENGIFFGFKKPLLFFPFDVIESTSYTSVLQRTFNLNIAYRSSPGSEPQEIEFSMIDQADANGIDTYLKKHQLQDASMAEARRAKKVKVNGVKKEAGEDGEPDDDRTELQKAQDEIDEEDEEDDEDFEGSDEDSDGSGTSEEEDEYEDGGAEGHDLIEEELGSEAEEVEPDAADDDDDDQL